MNTWLLAEDRFVPSLVPSRESIYTIGNGYLSTRGSFEEDLGGEIRASFINGLYVSPPGELPLLGAVPDWTGVSITIDGVLFSLDGKIGGYQRNLDMRSGILEREVLWRGAETGVVKIRFRRLVSMAERHLAALELTFLALTEDSDLRLETGINTSIPSPNVPAWNPLKWSSPARSRLRLVAESIDGDHRLSVDSAVYGPGHFELIGDHRHHRLASEVRLEVGRPVTFTKFAVYHVSRDPDPASPLPAPSTSFDEVAAASARAWAKRWRASNVEIDGDPASERGVRFAAFQVVAAAPPKDAGASIGGRMAAGFGYRHHVFWDTDVFIVPYLTVTHPDLARNHLAYRYRGLDGARRKAKKYGREGAFYAWESAGTGDEVTPEWSSPLFGPPSRIWTGEIEEHITSDVAYAADHYWRWTADDRFMLDEGVEIVVEGARYWASRLEVEKDGAHVRNVIGPDEYHTHVNDSYFTNLFAAWQLRRAASLVEWARKRSAAKTMALTARIGLEPADPGRWRQLANRIVLRRGADGVWEQHRGFFEAEPVNISSFSPRRMAMYDLLGEERAERSQVIKQPDVVMAMAMLPQAVGTEAVHRANWAYYFPRCDHGSSLSLAVHARVACDLGYTELAYELFLRAMAIDLENTMGNGQDGIHAATQGGVLQATLFGFGGLALQDGEPVTRPRLPDHWKELQFSFSHQGIRYERELRMGKRSGMATAIPRNRNRKKGDKE